jgi:hypothetical protein
MGWSYKVNVMAAFLLEVEHICCQFSIGAPDTVTVNAYVIVLAEYALQVAMG